MIGKVKLTWVGGYDPAIGRDTPADPTLPSSDTASKPDVRESARRSNTQRNREPRKCTP